MPASHRLALDLRPATLDDVGMIADLEATRDPADPRDPEMMRYWWTSGSLSQVHSRLVAVRDGQAVAFVGAGHERWAERPERFGSIRVVIRADEWSQPEYVRLVRTGEGWLKSEGVVTAVARVREDFKQEVEELRRIGYREVRRLRFSELDLIANCESLLAELAQAIELGSERVRTANDDANAPMLHINEEMGYRVVAPSIELHRDLES